MKASSPTPGGAGPRRSRWIASARSILRKTYLFTFLRGWLVWSSYRAQVGLTFVSWVVPVFLFFVLAGFLGTSGSSIAALDGGSYVAFFVVGLAFQGFVANLVGTLAQRIRSEQMMGTLEQVFLSPTTPEGVLVYSSVFGVVLNIASAGVILAVGWGILGVHFAIDPITVLLASILLAVSSVGLSSIAASFILWTKQGNPVALFFQTFTQFFAGVLFPISVLPGSIRWLSYVVPLTFGLDALRGGLLANAAPSAVAPALGAMAAYSVISIPIGLALFRWTLAKVKVEGTVATY